VSEIVPRTHYPDRGARGTATLVMEFAHGPDAKEGETWTIVELE